MTNQKLITDDELELIKNHFRKNKDYYAVGGIMLVTGVLMGKKMRKPVSVDRAAIFNEMLIEKANQGYSIYALNKVQHELWQAVHEYAEEVAQDLHIPVTQLLTDLTQDYRSAWRRKA